MCLSFFFLFLSLCPLSLSFVLFHSSQIPEGYTFIQVVDIFIKMHHVFNFEYGTEFNRIMRFLDYVFYGVKSAQIFMSNQLYILGELLQAEDLRNKG